nr:MAG TPA: hypothetical protein [Caudoviricetes sp.]
MLKAQKVGQGSYWSTFWKTNCAWAFFEIS